MTKEEIARCEELVAKAAGMDPETFANERLQMLIDRHEAEMRTPKPRARTVRLDPGSVVVPGRLFDAIHNRKAQPEDAAVYVLVASCFATGRLQPNARCVDEKTLTMRQSWPWPHRFASTIPWPADPKHHPFTRLQRLGLLEVSFAANETTIRLAEKRDAVAMAQTEGAVAVHR